MAAMTQEAQNGMSQAATQVTEAEQPSSQAAVQNAQKKKGKSKQVTKRKGFTGVHAKRYYTRSVARAMRQQIKAGQ